MRGRASGVPLNVPIWAVFTVSEGKMLRGTAYRSEEEARDAAGPHV